ncbi:MAG: MarR family transcriptional regulator [Christiangramia sp.]|nr:MarR family transcriptional regulator [Christiangramia sp.]
MEKLEDVIFYTIEKTIKSYRQFAQNRIKKAGYKITIDQWLILKKIQENPDINQYELGKRVFKDSASVTRIIDLLVKSGFLKREENFEDRRRKKLLVSNVGSEMLRNVQNVVLENRSEAIKGIPQEELENLKKNLQLIINNVS